MKQELLSIIVPAYNEESTVKIFLEETEKYTAEMPVDVEYLFVDDGSTDNTMEKLRNLSEKRESTLSLLLQKFWEGSSHICGDAVFPRGLCGHHGCRSAGPAVFAPGNVQDHH